MNIQRVVVTGSSGFIGTNLVEALSAKGTSVLGLDSVAPKNPQHKIFWKHVDILERQQLVDSIRDFAPDVVVHLGARTDLDGLSVDDYRANHGGTQHVMNAADACPSVKKVIFASTRLVNRIGYEPKNDEDYCPTTYYGESKVLGEQLVRTSGNSGYEWAIVRPTSIWGPWFGVPYRTFFDTVLAGRYVHPRGRRVFKSFGYVGNVIFELMSLIRATPGRIQGATYYLADYQPIEVYSFAKEVARQAGRGSIKEVPLALLKGGAVAGDLLKKAGWQNPPLTSFRLSNLITEMHYQTANLEAITGPLPFSHEAGIARTLEWMDSPH